MALIARSELSVAALIIGRSTATVEVRERLALQEWPALLRRWDGSICEWAILSTCHRFELYFVAAQDEMESACAQLQAMILRLVDEENSLSDTQQLWIVRHDEDATEHLCRVAAGLDSLVFGEAQIQGQVISSYTEALEAGTVGPMLSTLFRTAIRVGKRARTETQISARAVSMSSVALSMAARYFEDFSKVRVLVIGAGEMSRLALKALHQRHVTVVTVANRTLANAENVLLDPQWRAEELEIARASLGAYDVIFSATSASGYVITSEKFKQSLASSGTQRKQVLIDLALPRDIDPALRTFPDVVLVDVDDLRQGLDRSLEFRKQAIPAVLAIIDEEVARWQAQQRELSMRPVVVKLRQHAEEIRRQEVARTMRFLGPVDVETQEHIHHLTRALVNKLLHEPTIRIKELAHTDDADAYASAICDLFGLHNHHQNGHHNGNGEQDVTAETGKDVGLASGSESDLEIEPEIDIVEEHAKFSGEAVRP